MLKKKRIIIFTIFILPLLFFSQKTAAEMSVSQQLQQESKELQAQLQEIEKQIAAYTQELKQIGAEKNTLANKIKQLKSQQNKIVLQIKETNLRINNLAAGITKTQGQIGENQNRISWLKDELGAILKEIYIYDQHSGIEILLSSQGMSGWSDDFRVYQALSQHLSALVDQLNSETTDLEIKEQQLSDQKEEQQNFAAMMGLQSDVLQGSINEQNVLLTETKGKEANYQATLSDTKKKAAEIKSRIYNLFGVGKNITFGEAVQIAQWVSSSTGVRPAFLLAILTQESNLGKNVGTCNRPGDPPEKSWKVIMKPSRDQEPFKQITAELGLDPDTTPVSCPMFRNGEQIGWGGAMGPAQFIPSTWMGYKDKVSAITGKTADPWDIRDAFIAAAIKLAADGAANKDGEWAAAMRYFSGSTNPAYSFYGDNVVKIAVQYEQDIQDLNN